MIKLERLERYILISLIAALVLGIGISALRKYRAPIPVTIERFDPENYKSANDDNSFAGEKININTASAEELMKIKGIGKVVAGRIVEYRYNNGNFASTDDLKNVKGVGVALFEKIKTKITVE